MKRVCITGAHSYVGTHVASLLEHVDLVNVRDGAWKTIDFSQYDVVFHCAGLAHSTPDETQRELYYQVNTDLTYEIAKQAKASGVSQFIFMSSLIVYNSKETYITKDTPLEPDNFYGDSKKQAEKKLKLLSDDSFKVVIVRSPMIYGKDSKGNYPRLSKLARSLPIFPSLKNERSMLYIGNLSIFIKKIIDLELDGVFFPQNEELVSTSRLVTLINPKIRLVSIFNPILRKMDRLTVVNKVFGNRVIDSSLSQYSFSYQKYNLEQSIQETER